MNLSPTDQEEIKRMTAQILADRIQALVGDLDQYIVFPMAVAEKVLSLTSKQIPIHLPVTAVAPGKHGVTLSAIRSHITAKTTGPLGKTRKSA